MKLGMTMRGKAVLKEAGGMIGGGAGRGEGEEGGPLVGSERPLCSEEGGCQVSHYGKGSKQRMKRRIKSPEHLLNNNLA